jgi:hypothetical protein
MRIVGANWYQIPSHFPLAVSPPDAINSAVEYAISSLGMQSIVSAQVAFIGVQDHLYYAVTLTSYGYAYILVVNPRTGAVGLPTS